jgi:thioredoxin-dependent peroxiredoxin
MRTRLKSAEEAPEFEAVTYDGREISSDMLLGKKTWLCFYRYLNCPLCKKHLFEIGERQKALDKAGLQIFAVFESLRLKFRADDRWHFPEFPLICDPDNVLYDAYGVERNLAGVARPSVATAFLKALLGGFTQGSIDGKIARIPAHFLISEDGTVAEAYYGRNIADHIPWSTVEAFMKQPAVPVPKEKLERVKRHRS